MHDVDVLAVPVELPWVATVVVQLGAEDTARLHRDFLVVELEPTRVPPLVDAHRAADDLRFVARGRGPEIVRVLDGGLGEVRVCGVFRFDRIGVFRTRGAGSSR